jgi:transposase
LNSCNGENEVMARYFEFPEELKQYDFVELYRKEQNPRLKIRYLGLSYLKDGKRLMEVSKLIHVTYETIASWVKKVESRGISVLADKPKSGRSRKFPKSKLPEFKNEVLQLQATRLGGRIIAKDVKQLIEEKYNCQCCIATVYNLLAAAGLVWITGRSSHPKLDIGAQEEYKKTFQV